MRISLQLICAGARTTHQTVAIAPQGTHVAPVGVAPFAAEMSRFLERTCAVQELIAGIDERRARAFTLVELGGQRVSEIAKALGTKVNTMQARLRAARRDFEPGVIRRQARSGW